MNDTQNSKSALRYGGCLLLLLAGIGGLLAGINWFFGETPPRPAGPLPPAILWTATPTSTPTATPTPTLPPAPPTPVATGGITLGDRVQVTGVGVVGLSIRAAPGTAAERISIAGEGEIFIVIGGPQEVDNLTWWRLRDEANPQREGWAAGDYLVEAP